MLYINFLKFDHCAFLRFIQHMTKKSQNSSFNKVTGYSWMIGIWLTVRAGTFLFATTISRPAVRPFTFLFCWYWGAFTMNKMAGPRSWLVPPSSAKIYNLWNFTFIILCLHTWKIVSLPYYSTKRLKFVLLICLWFVEENIWT